MNPETNDYPQKPNENHKGLPGTSTLRGEQEMGSEEFEKIDDRPEGSTTIAADLFDLERLRLSQSFVSSAGVKKLVTTVPVRKPSRQDFIRVRAGEDWCLQTAVLELKEERETYLVDPSLWPELGGEFTPKVLFTAMNRQGVLSLWPVRLPGEDGRLDEWNRSALEAAEMAKSRWVRVAANMSLGAYEIFVATGNLRDLEYPDMTFQEILEIAFRGKFINDHDHPILRRLRGES
jgi:hypothetical protein